MATVCALPTVARGPSWIAWVDFNTSWGTARVHGRVLQRMKSFDGNFVDVDSREVFWVSGLKRDRTDTRYGPATTVVDDDAHEAYEGFLAGAPLPGRERG